MRIPSRLLALLVLTASPLWSQLQVKIPESGPNVLNPRIQDFLRDHGLKYGLTLAPDGGLLYSRADIATGKVESRKLAPEVAQKILQMLEKLPPEDFDAAMAQALRAYMSLKKDPGLERMLFERDARGRERLTPLGRNVLMDILTAQDGLAFRPRPDHPSQGKGKDRKTELQGRLEGTRSFGLGAPGSLFDGSRASGLFQIRGLNWSGAGVPDTNGFAVDRENGTVRLMIAARHSVQGDRLVVRDPAAEAEAIYREAGLDPALLARHQARVVRAMDNLVSVDLPLSEAAPLGKALAAGGIESRPAREFRSSAALAANALLRGPSWPDPLYSMLPLPTRGSFLPGTQEIQPMNDSSRDLMGIAGLWKRGMTGRGSVVGVIDSGLDLTHPDFKDRVLAYIDLSDSGLKDTVAHGTHVAGSIGGDGSGSQGLYKGMAPETKFVILKVFGNSGSASEDTVIAAMKAARSLPEAIRPQIVNMSLGGPGDADKDPISQLANEMMIQDNILMAIAAGNDGPSKGTVSSPGNARYVLTVTGVNKEKKFSFFPSRGPVTTSEGKTFNKPDISTVAGDVSATARRQAFWKKVIRPFTSSKDLGLFAPQDPSCVYGPGVVSARSSDDSDKGCAVAGNPLYRYMTGTSMATPMAAGIAADAIGYAKQKGHAYKASEVKALMMETATDLGQAPEVQGAGLVNGERLAAVLAERVERGLPIGNVAYALSRQLGRWDQFNMRQEGRFVKTDLGILDTKTQRLVNTDVEYDQAMAQVQKGYKNLPWYAKAWRKVKYWAQG